MPLAEDPGKYHRKLKQNENIWGGEWEMKTL